MSAELISDPGPNPWDLILAEIDEAINAHYWDEIDRIRLHSTDRGDK